jgi:hypothetical protein
MQLEVFVVLAVIVVGCVAGMVYIVYRGPWSTRRPNPPPVVGAGICPACRGTGSKSGLPPQETWVGCPQCRGTGRA